MTLRTQTALMTGLLLFGLIGTLTVCAGLLGTFAGERLIRQQLATLTKVMADRLDRSMFERWREIGTLSRLEVIQDMARDRPQDLRPVLDSLQRSLPEYAWIGLAAPDGTVLAATGGVLERASVAERPWFQGGMRGPVAGDLHTAVLLQNQMAPGVREPLRFVDVAFPVRGPDGTVIGVLGAHLSWTWAAEVRQSVLSQEDRENGIHMVILGEDGRLILGDGESENMTWPFLSRLSGARGGHMHANGSLFGFARTSGHRDYPGLKWVIAAHQPTAIAFAPVWRMVGIFSALGVIVTLAGIALAWLFASRLTRPLHVLTVAAELVGRDPRGAMMPIVHGAKETSDLSLELRALVRRLGGVEEQLESVSRANATLQAEHSQEVAALRHAAETDPLTGVLNRRAFLDRAAQTVALARRYGHPLAVAAIDIDHFKRVNDTHGHGIGDQVIRRVAEITQAIARDTDLVARYGGEEFVVLVMEADRNEVMAFGERLRAAISADKELLDTVGGLTVSVGCAVIEPNDADVEVAVARADKALYAAKRGGRNRVTMAQIGPAVRAA